jgi:hypothetical protein
MPLPQRKAPCGGQESKPEPSAHKATSQAVLRHAQGRDVICLEDLKTQELLHLRIMTLASHSHLICPLSLKIVLLVICHLCLKVCQWEDRVVLQHGQLSLQQGLHNQHVQGHQKVEEGNKHLIEK